MRKQQLLRFVADGVAGVGGGTASTGATKIRDMGLIINPSVKRM